MEKGCCTLVLCQSCSVEKRKRYKLRETKFSWLLFLPSQVMLERSCALSVVFCSWFSGCLLSMRLSFAGVWRLWPQLRRMKCTDFFDRQKLLLSFPSWCSLLSWWLQAFCSTTASPDIGGNTFSLCAFGSWWPWCSGWLSEVLSRATSGSAAKKRLWTSGLCSWII